MRKSPHHQPELERWFIVYHCVFSVNDLTVPYMTAYVDLEDPFLHYHTDELTVYVALLCTDMQADSLLGIMTTNISQLSNLSPYLTPRAPNAKKLSVFSLGSGSNLTDHPFRPAFKDPFHTTW
jgi:hypothetical protein